MTTTDIETTATEPARSLVAFTAAQMTLVPLRLIRPNPWQPRTTFDAAELQELAASIREHGLQQPPKVRPVNGGEYYELAFGERRTRALGLAGFTDAMIFVEALSDSAMAMLALEENNKRKDITPIETYRAVKKALEIEGVTITDVAAKMGLDRSTVSNNLRLLSLPEWVLAHVTSGDLSAHGAREFLCLQGSDGHFHEAEARAVMYALENGTPDWRVSRVRYELHKAVERQPVAEWRPLHSKDLQMGAAPRFDVASFKQRHAVHVHLVPADDWGYQSPATGKLKAEGATDWTCATSKWVSAQQAASKETKPAGGAPATSRTSQEPSRSKDFRTTLTRDAVMARVAQETQTTAAKLVAKDGSLPEAVTAALGTRAAPVLLKKDETFKALVDERELYGLYGYNATTVPSHIADIEECRKTCTIGATWAQVEPGKPLFLWCLNQTHFDEKVAAGRARVVAKMEKDAKALDAANDQVLGTLSERGLPALPHLLAAALLQGQRFGKLSPEGLGYEEASKLAMWPANTRRIFELLGGQEPGNWVEDALIGKIGGLGAGDVSELVLRLLTYEARQSKAIAQFVPKAPAADGPSRVAPADEAEAAVQSEAVASLANKARVSK